MSQGDGEKELILGNKQLISLFFVVVALCGVVFAMGYMIGRNSTKPASPMADGTTPPASDSGQRKQPDVKREDAAQTDPGPSTSGETTLQTQPAQTAGDGQPVPQTPVPATLPPAPEPEKPVADKAKPTAEAPPKEYKTATSAEGGVRLTKPMEGTSFWQVAAYSKRTDADGLVVTLQGAKLPVILYRMPDDLYHVLVGPYRTAVPLSDAKTQLKTLGFGQPLLKKF